MELAAIAAITSAVGGGISAIAGYTAGMRDSDRAEKNAASVQLAANAEEERLRRDRVRRMGAIRAAYGAAGVQMTGTPLEVLGDQAMEAELDALTVRHGGRVQAESFEDQADESRNKAIGSLIGGTFEVGTSLLGSAEKGAFKKKPSAQSSSDIWY